jgi:hypothetical protein
MRIVSMPPRQSAGTIYACRGQKVKPNDQYGSGSGCGAELEVAQSELYLMSYPEGGEPSVMGFRCPLCRSETPTNW